MGTRHLTVIVKDNEIRLAQYGQWDGYYSGQGENFTNFVRNKLKNNIGSFSEKVDLLENIDDEYYDNIVKHYNEIKKNKEFFIPFQVMFPQFSRDTGTDILNVINNLSLYDFDGKSFPIYIEKDSDWVEFIYAINLDTEEIYMLTVHDFDESKNLKTCEIIEAAYPSFKCWYKSTIDNIHTEETIEKFYESLEL